MNALVWLAWFAFAFGSWLVLEALGYLRVTPWLTLSETVWQWETDASIVRWVLMAGLTVLMVHLVARWP